MSVTIKGTLFVPVSQLDFGDPFFHEGVLYVKSRPAGTDLKRYNCVGVGHEGCAYLWKEGVQPASIVAEAKSDDSI